MKTKKYSDLTLSSVFGFPMPMQKNCVNFALVPSDKYIIIVYKIFIFKRDSSKTLFFFLLHYIILLLLDNELWTIYLSTFNPSFQ